MDNPGVKEKKTDNGSEFVVNGVTNPEQIEQDIVTTLRSRTKFNVPLSTVPDIFAE